MLLLIPGPVTTHPRVRAAAAHDYAPWDHDFRELYARLRTRILAIAGGHPGEHATIPLPGCGHFALEACIRTFVPPGGRILLPLTGQYADRLRRLATEAGRTIVPLAIEENQPTNPDLVQQALEADPTITHLACVYSETSSGIIHDAPALARAAGRAGRRVIVDAVSALGALPFDIAAHPMVDSVTFTSNKCFEGLPGSSFTVASIPRLEARSHPPDSWSMDLAAIYRHAVDYGWGSPRFTPAAGALAAFDVALDLFEAEGGQPARLARYTANMQTLFDGVQTIGLRPTLPRAVQGPVVLNVDAPNDPTWNLQTFVDALKRQGTVISNFHNTPHPSIRLGCIGAVSPPDMHGVIGQISAVLSEMGIARPALDVSAAA